MSRPPWRSTIIANLHNTKESHGYRAMAQAESSSAAFHPRLLIGLDLARFRLPIGIATLRERAPAWRHRPSDFLIQCCNQFVFVHDGIIRTGDSIGS